MRKGDFNSLCFQFLHLNRSAHSDESVSSDMLQVCVSVCVHASVCVRSDGSSVSVTESRKDHSHTNANASSRI